MRRTDWQRIAVAVGIAALAGISVAAFVFLVVGNPYAALRILLVTVPAVFVVVYVVLRVSGE